MKIVCFSLSLSLNERVLSNSNVRAATTGEMIYIGYNLIDIDGDGVTEVTVGVIGADGRRTRREARSFTHTQKM